MLIRRGDMVRVRATGKVGVVVLVQPESRLPIMVEWPPHNAGGVFETRELELLLDDAIDQE